MALLCRLDEVVDAHALTEVLLEVMPNCCRPVQQGILELLPELVLEQDCEVSHWPSSTQDQTHLTHCLYVSKLATANHHC